MGNLYKVSVIETFGHDIEIHMCIWMNLSRVKFVDNLETEHFPKSIEILRGRFTDKQDTLSVFHVFA